MRQRNTAAGGHRPGAAGAPGGLKPFGIELLAQDGSLTMVLRGRFDHHDAADALREARARLEGAQAGQLVIDLAGVEFLDSAGALAVVEVTGFAEERGITARVANATHDQQALIDLIDRQALAAQPLVQRQEDRGAAERMGAATVRLARELIDTVAFAGRLLRAAGRGLAHPRSIHWEELWADVMRIGVDGLPLIGLLSFLMGFIIASMAVSNLRELSMNTLISSVVGVAMIQEFGPLITSLVSAGRVGSAFAAEIATMTVHEEVDALAAMGYEPVAFLGVPKLFATVIALPLLTMYADGLGLLGGLVVARAQLQVSAYPYFTQIPGNVSLFSFLVAIVKTFIFAFIVATIGCRMGFTARGGAEGVGRATTSAVVAGILLVIFTDFLFASLVNYLG